MQFFKWLLYFVSLTIFVWFVFFRNESSTSALVNTTATIDLEQLELFPDPGFVDDLEESINDNSEGKMTNDIVSPDVIENSEQIATSEYIIVLGSFSEEKNAKAHQEKISQFGLKPQISFKEPFYRVVLESFKTESEAKQRIQELKNNHNIVAFVTIK
jgi:hypothetical protein